MLKTKFVEKNLKKGREKISEIGETISDKVAEMQFNTARYVKRNPLKTVGYSVLAGMIIARFLRLRK